MNNIKKYKDFLVEELSPEIFRSAATKLHDLGHIKRADELRKHYHKYNKFKIQLKDIEPAEFYADGELYIVLPENIKTRKYGTGMITIDIMLKDDKGIYLKIIDNEINVFNDSIFLDDRKSARNLLEFLKKWSYANYDDSIIYGIKKLTINQLYKDKDINEELSPETYWNAANKLINLGHKTRSKKLRKYGTKIYDKNKDTTKVDIKDIKPAEIYVDGEYYIILPEMVMVKPSNFDDSAYIYIELNYYDAINIFINDNDTYIEDQSALLDDRKSAINLLKFLKKWSYTTNDDFIIDNVKLLTINELYTEKEINEELSPETYKSAATKLKAIGHEARADNINDHIKELSKNIQPSEITVGGENYVILPEMLDITYVTHSKEKEFYIDILIDVDKEEFEKYGDEVDGKIITLGLSYIDNKYKLEMYGNTLVDNRKSANSLFRFLKRWASFHENPHIKTALDDVLTVNKLYSGHR